MSSADLEGNNFLMLKGKKKEREQVSFIYSWSWQDSQWGQQNQEIKENRRNDVEACGNESLNNVAT